jgi:cysteine-rich repeat protein
VNNQRLSTYAGGFDDGYNQNGGLLTVGDYTDSNANPANPLGNQPDDELYSLVPFVSAGDTAILVDTSNPSNDDNIFLAAVFTTLPSSAVIFCGDGNLDLGEECDDNNNVPDDGCSAICTIECTGTDRLTVQSASASSVESDISRYFASKAVDGLQNSRWASKGPTTDNASHEQWIQLDLGGIRYIDSMLVEWERAFSRQYDIEVSLDGINWTIERTILNGNGGQVIFNSLDVFARYVRISSHLGDRNYGVSIYEITIFGKDCTPPPPTTCRGEVIDLAAAIASASSIENSRHPAEDAIDDDLNTRWASAFTDDAWLAVDLGAPTLVHEVWIYWENAYAQSYNVEVADSPNGPWRPVAWVRNSDGGVDINDGLYLVTQYVRVLCLERARENYGNSIFELQVRGTQDPDCLPRLPGPP